MDGDEKNPHNCYFHYAWLLDISIKSLKNKRTKYLGSYSKVYTKKKLT